MRGRPPKKPTGVRVRTLKNGEKRYDAMVWERGEQIPLGACETESEAIALRHAYFQHRAKELGESENYDSGALTVRQLGHLYLDTLSETAQRTDRNRWKSRIEELAAFIDFPVSQVGPDHVRIWISKMCKTPITTGKSAGEIPSRTTVQNSINLLRGAYRWACMPDQGYALSNPVDGVTISSSTTARPKKSKWLFDYLREHEAKIVMETEAIGLEPKTKFLTLMFSGARPSDVWRMAWSRIDWKALTIEFGNKKTGRSYVVHMLPQLVQALRKWWLASGRPTKGLVFPSEASDDNIYAEGYDAGWADRRKRKHWLSTETDADGERVAKKSADVRVVRGYRSKMGITRNVPLYALRHTGASHLLLGSELFTGGRRWSREEVQAHLGHTSSKTTERYMVALGLASKKAAEDSREALRVLKGGKPPEPKHDVKKHAGEE